MEDSSTYWSTIAQIVPVLAITMALENRLTARKWLKKSRYLRSRSSRVFAAWTIVSTSFILFFVLAVSLVALAWGASAKGWLSAVVLTMLCWSVGVVLFRPVLLLALVLAGDAIVIWVRRQWWSKHARALRALDNDLETTTRDVRGVRARNIELWGNTAAFQVAFHRHLRGVGGPQTSDTLSVAATHLAQIETEVIPQYADTAAAMERTANVLKGVAERSAKSTEMDSGEISTLHSLLRSVVPRS